MEACSLNLNYLYNVNSTHILNAWFETWFGTLLGVHVLPFSIWVLSRCSASLTLLFPLTVQTGIWRLWNSKLHLGEWGNGVCFFFSAGNPFIVYFCFSANDYRNGLYINKLIMFTYRLRYYSSLLSGEPMLSGFCMRTKYNHTAGFSL